MDEDWLEPLLHRQEFRIKRQRTEPDLLPGKNVDLEALRTRVVVAKGGKTVNRHRDLDRQGIYLSQVFEGKSELEYLHALCISYLRRKTAMTGRASAIFFRMWDDHGEFLAEQLTARWLISALQTFYDYGRTDGERAAGIAGFLYGNFIKVYEAERAAMRPRVAPKSHQFGTGLAAVEGLFGIAPGDDILTNMNVLVLDAAVKGGAAGLPLLRLMQHVREGKTIFKRIDDLANDPAFRQRRTYTLSWGTKLTLSDGKTEQESS